ncbi:Internalin-A [bioreactor metagenome]|uniref:Internalin-A n=1 Tax=bioreactor metagenome TaxID=1076179 RepID=A0A645FAW1_9ZZZZ
MAIALAACGTPAAQQTDAATPAPVVTEAPATEPTAEPVVVFTDAVLEAKVREAMGKPEGDITLAEAEVVTELILNMDGSDWAPPRIASVSDLAQFPNQKTLELNWALCNGDEAIDLSPLSGLTKLERLFVCCDNISDLSALAGMTKMKELWIWGNGSISDISALAGMTQTERLWIKGNQIADISALAGMKNLCLLYMEENQITDVTPLAGLTNLTALTLGSNPIADYSPLAGIYPNLTEKDFELNGSDAAEY